MANIQQVARRVGKTLQQNSPSILSALAVGGVVTTAVLASKATAKSVVQAYELTYEKTASEQDGLEPAEWIKLSWKNYIPATLMAASTIGFIIGANSIGNRRNAALASAYTLSDTAFREYKEKVVEQIGKNQATKVHDKVMAERVEKEEFDSKEVIIMGSGEQTCFDTFSGRFFKSNMEDIRKAVNDFNQRLLNNDYASLNEFFRMIGLNPTDIGETLGFRSNELMNLDYSSSLKDDKPVLTISFRDNPIPNYYKVW